MKSGDSENVHEFEKFEEKEAQTEAILCIDNIMLRNHMDNLGKCYIKLI